MNKALVTGSDGFVARHLIPKLTAAGYAVHPSENLEATLTQFEGREFDVIVHLAANIVNVDQRARLGMLAYEDIALDYRMCKYVEMYPPREVFVAMSSCAVDFPDDPYCVVKQTLEAFTGTLKKKGVPVAVLRPFSGYGHDQSYEYPFPAIFQRAMMLFDPLEVWSKLTTVRDWIHIDDLTDAIMMAVAGAFPRGVPVEIGTGKATDFGTLAHLIGEEVHRRQSVGNYHPVIRTLEGKIESSPRRVAQTRRAKHFGFEAKISLEEGIRRAADFYYSTKATNDIIQPTR